MDYKQRPSANVIKLRPIAKRPMPVQPIIMKRPAVNRPRSAPLPTRNHRAISPAERISKKLPAVTGGPKIVDRSFKIFEGIGVGRTLVIVANGPSHKMAELDKIKDFSNVDIMCINKPDSRLWPTKFWLFADKSQYRRHTDLWESYRGITFNTPAVNVNRENGHHLKILNGKGFSLDLHNGVHIGRSSTYVALQVANYMRFDKVYIFGCDMSAVGGSLYPWGSNPDVKDETRESRFKHEASHFTWAADNLPDDMRKRFIFCSEHNPWPFVHKFRSIPHQVAINEIVTANLPI